MTEKEIIRNIEITKATIKKLKENIKWYRKEIYRNNDKFGILKIDCRNLIKTIDNLIENKNKLERLYCLQNQINLLTKTENQVLII